MNRICGIAAVLVLLSCSIACNKNANEISAVIDSQSARPASNFVADTECLKTIKSLDFSDFMPQLIEESARLQRESPLVSADREALRVNPDDDELTACDRAIANGFQYASRWNATMVDGRTIHEYSEAPSYVRAVDVVKDPASTALTFTQYTGRLPEDGAELLLFSRSIRYHESQPTLNDTEGLTEFLGWSRAKQLDYVMPFINLSTGRIYGNFADSGWTPGGISITSSTEADVAAIKPRWKFEMDSNEEAVPAGYRITVFGSEPERVVSQWLYLNISDSSAVFADMRGMPNEGGSDPIAHADMNPSHSADEQDVNPCNPCNPCNPDSK
ncbi:MAG: hypothetical protein R3F46_01810 [bacterium]